MIIPTAIIHCMIWLSLQKRDRRRNRITKPVPKMINKVAVTRTNCISDPTATPPASIATIVRTKKLSIHMPITIEHPTKAMIQGTDGHFDSSTMRSNIHPEARQVNSLLNHRYLHNHAASCWKVEFVMILSITQFIVIQKKCLSK